MKDAHKLTLAAETWAEEVGGFIFLVDKAKATPEWWNPAAFVETFMNLRKFAFQTKLKAEKMLSEVTAETEKEEKRK